MNREIDVDYLIVGAGAAGMAFTDELLTHTDATIAIVDRRAAPGGHWIDAYPFVRLHQPSAFYGVTSVPLRGDTLDTAGANAGFYELAGADEIRAYFERVMHRHFLATNRVQYFPCSASSSVASHAGQETATFTSRLTGAERRVNVRKKIVDARYLEGAIPATSPPPFEVAQGARCIPVGELGKLAERDRAERFVVIGAGKTAADACVWLLDNGVSPTSIRWIKPREAWWLNRKFQQPHTLVTDLYRGIAVQLEAMARAASVPELFALLEDEGFMLRVDRNVMPTMMRGAILSERELEKLRQIEDVVRMGRVRKIDADSIVLDEGRVPTDARTLHVHCAAHALARPPLRPIFESKRVTVQAISWGYACYQAATQGVIEAIIADDDEKNRLCQPIHYWEHNADYLRAFLAAMSGDQARAGDARLRAWMKATRLNPTSAINTMQGDARVQETRERIKSAALPAVMNLQQLLDAR